MGDRLQGTTAVVTGASSGIGEAVTRALVAHGATVAALARRRDRLETLAAELGDAVVAIEADVTDDDAVRGAIDRVAADHGGIGVLVNNAGYGAWSPALDADLAEWRRMVEVNLTAVLATSHAALPHLVEAATGPRGVADLVSISSIAGRKVPGPASNVYAATKHGVGAFSEALRVELAERHVRVGLVEPGIVTSEMTTSGAEFAPDARGASEYRALDPAAIADAVVYMVSRPRGVAVHEMLVRPTEQER
ncbi:SDR family oxidoreductase [Actinomycetospora sp. NBRC 106378]|uniref:SDR family oxidoreductase n=1 Tax=Actinomycetospora sp. NBRC 106378 TaxID=3032208 RepID=UPI0024A060D0|nr:SDR family oxidoreductase [Actinomycetospora sp. NBRC 106378]GLZ54216.1 oxidoreductase [Actinomycetospora sp. NBRC 106378]